MVIGKLGRSTYTSPYMITNEYIYQLSSQKKKIWDKRERETFMNSVMIYNWLDGDTFFQSGYFPVLTFLKKELTNLSKKTSWDRI